MSENHYKAEMILCNDRMDDKTVERRRKQSQPKAWSRAQTRTETLLHTSRHGVVARVVVERAVDADEPSLAAGAELLQGLEPSERAAIFRGETHAEGGGGQSNQGGGAIGSPQAR